MARRITEQVFRFAAIEAKLPPQQSRLEKC